MSSLYKIRTKIYGRTKGDREKYHDKTILNISMKENMHSRTLEENNTAYKKKTIIQTKRKHSPMDRRLKEGK